MTTTDLTPFSTPGTTELIPMHRIVTGMAVWNPADAARLAPAWQAWARTAPPQVTTSFRILSLPPLPVLPAYLAGKRVLALDGAAIAPTEPDLPAARRIVEEMLSPRSALEPALTGFTAPNFIDEYERPQRTYDDQTRAGSASSTNSG